MRVASAPLFARWSRIVLVTALLANVLAAFLSTPTVRAASFTVNSTTDAVDANPGDGVCETVAGNGVCTLRAAIQETNALAASGNQAITLPAGVYTLTIPGRNEDNAATGDLDIKSNLTISGASANTTVVQATALNVNFGIDRVFQILPGFTVSFSNMTIRNGNADDGGGIYNIGNLTLMNVTVTNNIADYEGGGILNGGPFITSPHSQVTLIGSTITDNLGVSIGGGGIYNQRGSIIFLTNSGVLTNSITGYSGFGAGIYNGGIATIDKGVVSGNRVDGLAIDGGGIYNSGMLTVTDTAITSNIAPSAGGIYASSGTATFSNTTIAGNNSGGVVADGSGTSVSLRNSTITSNGGGVGAGNGSTVTLTNVTIASNAGGIGVYQATVTLKNSIVANSSGANCTGTVTSGDYNLDSSATCGFQQPHDLSNANPLLGPLQSNAPGTTQTQALLPGSPAIDHGGTSANGCPATDQRGLPRPFGVACDIGAYEATYFVPPPPARTVAIPTPSVPVDPAPPQRTRPAGTNTTPVPPIPIPRP